MTEIDYNTETLPSYEEIRELPRINVQIEDLPPYDEIEEVPPYDENDNITDTPQFEGADFWLPACKKHIPQKPEGFKGVHHGYAKKLASIPVCKKYKTLAEAVEVARQYPQVKAITASRKVEDGVAYGASIYSLRAGTKIHPCEEDDNELTWLKE